MAQRVARRVLSRFDDSWEDVGIRPEDVASSTGVTLPAAVSAASAGPLRIGWVMTPPALGSGGHTTVFRMIAALERAGHDCSLHLYDVFDGDLRTQRSTIRQGWPDIVASVHSVDEGLPDRTAWIATSWQSAHVLASRPARRRAEVLLRAGLRAVVLSTR